jgi:hypothetical protein
MPNEAPSNLPLHTTRDPAQALRGLAALLLALAEQEGNKAGPRPRLAGDSDDDRQAARPVPAQPARVPRE